MRELNNIPGLPPGFLVQGFKTLCRNKTLELMLIRATDGIETKRYKIEFNGDTRAITGIIEISVNQYRRLLERSVNDATRI